MKLPKTYKPLILNGLALVLIILEILFLLKPSLAKIIDIKNRIITQNANVNLQRESGQTTDRVIENLVTTEPYLEKISTFFLRQGDQLSFITTLESIAEKNSMIVEIDLSDTPNIRTEDEVFTSPLTLNLKGSFADTRAFLIDLQRLDFYVNIINISMNAQEEDSNEPIITTVLRANTYWKN